jgi:hypothetical protein
MAYTCPRCGATSQHPDDEANRYCARCHQYETYGVQILNPDQVSELLAMFMAGEYSITPTADETPERPPASGPDRRP